MVCGAILCVFMLCESVDWQRNSSDWFGVTSILLCRGHEKRHPPQKKREKEKERERERERETPPPQKKRKREREREREREQGEQWTVKFRFDISITFWGWTVLLDVTGYLFWHFRTSVVLTSIIKSTLLYMLQYGIIESYNHISYFK